MPPQLNPAWFRAAAFAISSLLARRLRAEIHRSPALQAPALASRYGADRDPVRPVCCFQSSQIDIATHGPQRMVPSTHSASLARLRPLAKSEENVEAPEATPCTSQQSGDSLPRPMAHRLAALGKYLKAAQRHV